MMSVKDFSKIPTLCVFILFAVCSCDKDRMVPQGNEITVTASYASQTSPTGADSPFVESNLYWQNGDQISVFNGNGRGTCVAAVQSLSLSAKFSGQFSGTFSPAAETPVWGIFPSQDDATLEGKAVTARLVEKQTGKAGSFDRNANLFVAKSDSDMLTLQNVCSGIRFSLKKTDIIEVVIKSQNGEPVAGKVGISFKEGEPFVANVVEGRDEISISIPDGQCFKAGEWYFISMLPGTLEYGVTVSFYTADKYATKKIGTRMELSRGGYLSFENIDETVGTNLEELKFIARGTGPWDSRELSIEQRLMSLPDVVSVEEDMGFIVEYGMLKTVMFRLPIDHSDLSKGYFLNQVEIGVIDPDSLNVILFTGYSNFDTPDPRSDIASLVNGNQFKIEHRDFGKSLTNTGYAYLTTAQAAADQKQIIDNLKLMFHRRFAVTGVSKGGMTTALLAGYYPELDAVYVPKAAPFCRMPDDVKGHTFLIQDLLTQDIRTRMIALQRKMLALMDIPEVMDEFTKVFEQSPIKPDLSVKDAFYYQVQEYYPNFCQTSHIFDKLPDASIEGLELWNVVKSDLLPNYGWDAYVYNIQGLRELGTFGFNQNFSDIYTPECTDYCRAQVPQQCREESHNSGTYEKYIFDAVSSTQRPMLFIYGENDHWTAWAIDDKLVNGTNVRKYIVPGGFHNVKIDSFPDESTRKEVADWIIHYMYR